MLSAPGALGHTDAPAIAGLSAPGALGKPRPMLDTPKRLEKAFPYRFGPTKIWSGLSERSAFHQAKDRNFRTRSWLGVKVFRRAPGSGRSDNNRNLPPRSPVI